MECKTYSIYSCSWVNRYFLFLLQRANLSPSVVLVIPKLFVYLRKMHQVVLARRWILKPIREKISTIYATLYGQWHPGSRRLIRNPHLCMWDLNPASLETALNSSLRGIHGKGLTTNLFWSPTQDGILQQPLLILLLFCLRDRKDRPRYYSKICIVNKIQIFVCFLFS